MLSIRTRRAVAILVLAAASSILPVTSLHAAPRGESRAAERSERGALRAVRHGVSVWTFLRSLWEEAGLRIDDNG